jgi:hypothetical protein
VRGPHGVERQLQGTTADGVWYERAWGYHFYALEPLVHLAEAAHHCGIDVFGPALKRMFDAPLALAMPNGYLPAFDDSLAIPLTRYADLYEVAFAHYRDPNYVPLLDQADRQSVFALEYGEPLPHRVFGPMRSRNYPASGYGVLIGGPDQDFTWLCLDYGPRPSHAHPDQLSFVLYGLNKVIADDPGRINYGTPHHRGWYRTSVAHNTLVVDGRSQSLAEGRSEAFLASGGFTALSAATEGIYVGVSFRRTAALIGGRLLVFIDQIRADRDHTFDLAYHNLGRMTTFPPGDACPAPQGAGYDYLEDMRRWTTSSGMSLAFDYNGVEARWIMADGDETIYFTGTGAGRNIKDRVPLVIARRTGRSAVFCWCVTLGTPAEEVSVMVEPVRPLAGPAREDAAAVRVRTRTGDHILVTNPTGGEIQICGRTFRGPLHGFTDERRKTLTYGPALLGFLLFLSAPWACRWAIKRLGRPTSTPHGAG